MPEPITAPIPSAVRETGPSVFFNACSGLSDSEISLSIDLVAKICLASALAPAYESIGAGRIRLHNAISGQNYWISIRSRDGDNRREAPTRNQLPLALATGCLLDLLLVFATSACTRSLRWRRLTCCALYLLALLCVCDALGICHVSLPIFLYLRFSKL
jgi:hypothetical protein